MDIIATTTQKMKFSIKDLFSKCDQIRSFLQLMENFIFFVVHFSALLMVSAKYISKFTKKCHSQTTTSYELT